ncbi:MAG: AMP-binding protein [Pseudomonadales bacterium]|jgi:malonyl-CoA/methylmalonyl-CoA synthetase|nr:AMP-binding protein [Pseudomonadales bacterium]
MNLYDRIRLAAADRGDALAFECDDGRVLTHDDLHALVGRISARLLAAGLVPGDRVVVQVGKSVDAVALYLATLRLGGVFVPLNTAYTAAELEYFVSDAAPRVVVCAPEAREAVAASAQGVDPAPALLTLGQDGSGSLVDDVESSVPPSTPRDHDDLAAILYTSGTTGRSKGAMLTHGNLTANAVTLRKIWGWRADDVLLHILPIFHAHGLFVALHCALLEPSPILFHRRFDAAAVVAALPRASVLMGVPTHYVRLLEEQAFDRDRCAGMRLFISGSAPLRPETFDAFEARTGMRILERYGMTEAGMITSNPLDGARIAGTVGPPLPDVELRVVGENGRVLPAGEVGTVQIRGPNVFAGYWRMPDKTREEFDGDWFVTGDLGTCDGTGRLSIVGRGKDLIISGGLNVYPKEVEAALDALPGIAESAVVGVPHPDLGEAVVAVVVPETGQVPEEAALRAALRGGLAGFKVPRRVLAIDALPRNAMGKVQKNLLRERWAALFEDPAGV